MRRREFLQWASGVTLGVLTVGCGGDDDAINLVSNPANTSSGPTLRVASDSRFEVDSRGRLLQLEPLAGRIRAYSPSGQLLYTSSEVRHPLVAAIRADFTAYVFDQSAGDVVVLDPNGQLQQRFGARVLGLVKDLVAGQDELYLLDPVNLVIHVFSFEGAQLRSLSLGPPGSHLRGLVVDSERNLRVLRSNPFEIQVLSAANGQTVRAYGAGDGRSGRDFALTPDGRTMVVDHLGYRLLIFSSEGAFVGEQTVPDDQGDTSQPLHLSVGPDGVFYFQISEVA